MAPLHNSISRPLAKEDETKNNAAVSKLDELEQELELELDVKAVHCCQQSPGRA